MNNSELFMAALHLKHVLQLKAEALNAVVRGKRFHVFGTDYFYEISLEYKSELRLVLYAYFWNGYSTAVPNILDEVPDYKTNPRFRYALIELREWLLARLDGLENFHLHRKNRTKR